mmetsp:Transcript_25043/g.48716  ORF Transcript_25043/g.48716 Transcript_25043/m.48716 type:complete len:232 (+) Transcript_25043:422-1117(+)
MLLGRPLTSGLRRRPRPAPSRPRAHRPTRRTRPRARLPPRFRERRPMSGRAPSRTRSSPPTTLMASHPTPSSATWPRPSTTRPSSPPHPSRPWRWRLRWRPRCRSPRTALRSPWLPLSLRPCSRPPRCTSSSAPRSAWRPSPANFSSPRRTPSARRVRPASPRQRHPRKQPPSRQSSRPRPRPPRRGTRCASGSDATSPSTSRASAAAAPSAWARFTTCRRSSRASLTSPP